MSRQSTSLGFLFWIIFASFGAAGTITLSPSKDNTLIQTSGTAQLSNGQGDIFVGRTGQDGQGPATISIRRGLIAFDIADNIPAGSTITGGTLTMCDVQGVNGNQTVSLHDVLQNWGQGNSLSIGTPGAPAANGDATWLYTFYNSTTPTLSPHWTNPGGDFRSTVSGSAVINAGPANTLYTWSSAANPQMIADIQSWFDNPGTNFGWLLQGNESAGQTAKRLDGMFSTTAPNVPPTLTVSYVTVPEPATLWLAISAALALVTARGFRIGMRRL